MALSASGALLYSVETRGRRTPSELVWVSRDGSSAPSTRPGHGEFDYPALSPDGAALAVSVRDGPTQLWIRRSDGTRQKLTQEGTVNWRPTWSPDGRSVAYVVQHPRGSGARTPTMCTGCGWTAAPRRSCLLRHTYGLWEAELSRDGQWLVVRSDEPGTVEHVRPAAHR